MSLVLLNGFDDSGQFTRSCRIDNGIGSPNAENTTGDRFSPQEIWGFVLDGTHVGVWLLWTLVVNYKIVLKQTRTSLASANII